MAQYQSYITSSALKSIHPNQDVFPFTSSFFSSSLLSGSVAVGVGFGTSSNFRGEVLNRVIPSFFVSPTFSTTDKIRIIEQETNGDVLSPYLRTEKTNPIDLNSDTNQLNIVFSQTNQINKDILGQIGPYFTLDEYAGSVALQYEPNYIFLDNLKNHYLSKYKGKTNINAFIRLVENFDSSILETTEKVIPGRTNATIGTSIESHILDRSKVQRFEPTIENNTYIDGGLDARAQFNEFAISGDVFSGGKIAGTLYTSTEADKAFDSHDKSRNNSDIDGQNLDLFAPSDLGYTDAAGKPINYNEESSKSKTLRYGTTSNGGRDLNITSTSPTSTLVYIFDSLETYRIPTVNLSPVSDQLKLYYVSSGSGIIEDSNLHPINIERDANKLSAKILSSEGGLYNDIKILLTSSLFDIPEGSEITISGSFFQPNMGGFGLGEIPILGTPVIIDSGSSITGWITSSNPAEQPYISLSTDNNFPFPSSSNSHINYNVSPVAYYGGFPLFKTYNILSSGRHRVSFFVVSSINQTGNLLVEVKQNNQTRGSTTIPFSSIYYQTGIQQNIEFTSVSSSFELRFSHFGTGADVNYQIDTISTASYVTNYLAPHFKLRIITGSYQDGTGSFIGTELLSTGEIEAPTSNPFTSTINISSRVISSSTNAFLEIEFYTSKSLTGDTSFIDKYNNDPISINNLLINTGNTEEQYAFRIDKLINIDSENIEGSEIIASEDIYFTDYMDNEVTPDFNFSITNFGNTPNRLKPSYNVFTSSFGQNKGLVERGNLKKRNYIPVKLTFGDLETNDLPYYNNFNEKGIIFPINISKNLESAKQAIINFVKNDVENLR
jgi:hypothetical protein